MATSRRFVAPVWGAWEKASAKPPRAANIPAVVPARPLMKSLRLGMLASLAWHPLGEAVLRAAHITLGDHVDLIYRLCVISLSFRGSILFAVRARHACALGVKRLL